MSTVHPPRPLTVYAARRQTGQLERDATPLITTSASLVELDAERQTDTDPQIQEITLRCHLTPMFKARFRSARILVFDAGLGEQEWRVLDWRTRVPLRIDVTAQLVEA